MELENTLGTGSTAKVRKIHHKGRLCVAKHLPLKERGRKRILKEIKMHALMDHPFIIPFLGERIKGEDHCIILEYGPYSLRSLIEESNNAELRHEVVHMIFVQLIAAVEDMHKKGVCHRDIKPENILIGYDGNIRVTDFGSSTLFITNGRRRRLKSVSGSLEFMAPEVLGENYDGEAADVWSCGITLLNLFTGALPWKKASLEDERYGCYRELEYHCYEPYNRIPGIAKSLIDGMLREEEERFIIEDIQKHPWFCKENPLMDKNKLCLSTEYLKTTIEQGNDLYFSQPEKFNCVGCFVPSSFQEEQAEESTVQRLYFQGRLLSVISDILIVLDKMMVIFNLNSNYISFTTTDTRRNRLTGLIKVESIGENSMAILTKTIGDINEFAKFARSFAQNFT